MKLSNILYFLAFIVLLTGCDPRTPTPPETVIIDYKLTVTSNVELIYADQGKTVARITAFLTDADGIPKTGSTIAFLPSQGKMAGSGTTDQTGRAVSIFDDDGQPGEAVRIVAQYSDGIATIVRDTLYLQVLPMEALVDTFFVDTNPADGKIRINSIDESGEISVFAHIFDASGVPVENVAVNYRVVSNLDGVGFITQALDSTNSVGVSSTVFRTNLGRVGNATIEAYINGADMAALLRDNPGKYSFNNLPQLNKSSEASAIAFSASVTIRVLASEPYVLDIQTQDPVIYADNGITTARINAFLRDDQGNAISDYTINFFSVLGTITNTSQTNEFGRAEALFSDLGSTFTQDSLVKIFARIQHPFYGLIKDSTIVTVRTLEAGSNANFFVITNPLSGLTTVSNVDSAYVAKIVAYVRSDNGVAIEGVDVRFRISAGAGLGYLGQSVVKSDTSGVSFVLFHLNPGSTGTVEISVSLINNETATATQTVTLVFTPSQRYTLNVVATESVIFADQGVTTAPIVAVVRDTLGNPISGAQVFFSSDMGTINSPIITGTSGIANSIFSDLGSEFTTDAVATITARVVDPYHGALEGTVQVQILDPGDNANFYLSTVPPSGITTVSDPDSSYVTQILALVRSDDGVALANVDVNFRIITGFELGYLDRSITSSDINGSCRVLFNLNLGATGDVSVEANMLDDGIIAATDTVLLRFLPNQRYTLNIIASETLIFADQGETTSNIFGVVRDINGNPIPGVDVHFSSTLGTINSLATTDGAGIAQTIFSDLGTIFTTDSVATVTARVVDPYYGELSSGVNIQIRLPDDATTRNFFVITVPTNGIVVANNVDSAYVATIKGQVRDNRGVALEGVTVDFRVISGSALGFLSAATKVSDSTGTAAVTFTLNPGMSGMVTVECFIAGDANITPIQKDITFAPMDDYLIAVYSYQNLIYYDNGLSTANIYAIVRDPIGNPIDSVRVQFSSDIGSVASPDYTNNSGIAETIFSDIGAVGPDPATATITARVTNPFHGVRSSTVQVNLAANTFDPPRVPAFIEMSADYNELPPTDLPEIISANLSLFISDSSGFAVDTGTEVTFSTDIGFITPFTLTDANGNATATFTMGDSSGIAKVYAYSGIAVDSVLIRVRPMQASYIVMPPVTPNAIVVQGGWGPESTTLLAQIKDARGELVDLPYNVTFTIGPAPAGSNLDGAGNSVTVTSNYGVASVTLNSGTESGPVRVRVSTVNGAGATISQTGTPVIVRAGPPFKMLADIDIQAITPVGGGFYELQAAALVWDRYTNPVEDSVQVYWSLNPDTLADIIGESFTNNENLAGEHYKGMAWTKLYFNSGNIFNSGQIIARTWGADGDTVRAYVNGEDGADSTQQLTFYPGTLTVTPSESFHDFGTDPTNPYAITLTAYLIDHYGNAIGGGRILFQGIGPSGWFDIDGNAISPPVVLTDEEGIAQVIVTFDRSLCTPNFDAEDNVISYDPFTAYVWGTLIDPQITSSEQMSIELRRSIPE